MKKITFLLLSLVSFTALAQFPAPYCGPLTFTNNVEPITLVNFAGINNTSSALVGANNGTTIIAHEDYTAITGNVFSGSTYPITLKGNTDGNYTTYLRVFIDWNQNNDFTDAGESYDIGTIVNSTGADAVELVGSITAPGNALAGNTRMRVIKKFAGYSDSCNTVNTGWGQSEDYTLVVALPACLSPTAGIANVTSSTTANLTWTSGGAANAEVVIQPAGTGVPGTPDDTGVNVTGNTYPATLLLPQTAYEFYVRDECTLGSSFSTWAGPFTFNTTLAPSCAGNVAPIDGATNVVPGTVDFTWTAPTTGDPAVSYDLYYGLTPGNATILVGNYLTLTTPINITGFNTTFYWKIVPKNVGGSAVGCVEWSFTTIPAPGYCLNAPNGQWPGAAYTPETCDGLTDNVITAAGYAGEYSTVNVVLGQTYVFNSSIATDLITISADGGTTAAAYGTTPVTWVSTIDGQIRFYTHADNNCVANADNRTRSVICGIPSAALPDYVSLQWPPTATITQGGNVTVYGQVYEGGLTDVAPNIDGQAPGINAWVGYSTTNTNPNTWTDWVVATHNAGNIGNNDEYQATIGATLAPGTYYYATRFNLDNGAYVYGGINADAPNNGSIWDGATFGNGVLTVTPPPAPANDDCLGATVLVVDDTFCNGTNTNGTNLGATDSGVALAVCFNYGENDVWYSFVAPSDAATVDISTDFLGGTLYDTDVALYSGTCGALTEIDCDNDGGVVVQPNGFSWNSLILDSPVTANSTYYVRVSGYSDVAVGSFCLRVSKNQLLSNESFDSSNFEHYPNPVKNVLNLSYSQEISSVEVYNLLGQKMSTNTIGANLGQVDMTGLASGTYLVKVTAADNQSKTIRVIKE
ncbi:T9SS type A sorting domain-containing protein [Flavobacterium sp. 102]|uniref:T9SS type A sorting domain-containing protein n=1 Tax=Flavobacterium sp. 102 TaxID=2135623 RepID=UPI000EB1811E|nr:T9SS type A sorting domain-containing protein [Flavobacterium sp. 102]RKS02478.1 putative secreted protein (Por secretion system target) [Flavobacterium sp. 102]